MNKKITGLLFGAIAGIIDDVPMIVQILTWDAKLYLYALDCIRSFYCGYGMMEVGVDGWKAAVERGDTPDPAARAIPVIAQGRFQFNPTGPRTLTTDDIFPFEDSDGVLLTNHTMEQCVRLMAAAANEFLSVDGDPYDFIGFRLNFNPHHLIGDTVLVLMPQRFSRSGRTADE